MVQGVVFINCNDPACTPIILCFLDLGLASIHQPATLLLQWDKDNHRFIFTFDATTMVAPYTVSDAAPSSGQNKASDVQLLVANCTVAPRPVGSMDALFDNVFVNASAAVTTPTPSIKRQFMFTTDP